MLNRLMDKKIAHPKKIGSYREEDALFLLKDVSSEIVEKGTEDREEVIQGGGHYSEMLPIEYVPTDEYLRLYYKSMESSTDKIAAAVGIISEGIMKKRGKTVVLASLARAGTPFGILIKRYIKKYYGIDLPHYSISIIRGKGIDENAVKYIIQNHGTNIQFVDGWTGKGTIINVLKKASEEFLEKYDIKLESELAVIADPGYCSSLYGTREDFLIPSACLNSTVSGLVSRTVHRKDLIGEDDFHGAKYYKELIKNDLSNEFIDKISERFEFVKEEVGLELNKEKNIEKSFEGLKDIQKIKDEFGIKDINLIKPGIGETTRVLLRRVPWKILISTKNSLNIEHILLLAKEKGVEVVEYKMNSYECCGIIRPLETGEKEE